MSEIQSASRPLIYVNPKQAEFLEATEDRKTFMGGRGCGKSFVLGYHLYLCMRFLPRAKFLMLGLNFNNLMTKTFPAMEQAWGWLGLREYDTRTGLGHYVVGKRPPSGWLVPYSAPRNYERVVSFINGFAIEMMSQENPDSNRGGSYDGGVADESGFLKQDFLRKIGIVSIRGNVYRFSHHLHHSFCDFTSAPWKVSGQHIYEIERLMLEENEKVKAGKLLESKRTYRFIEAKTKDNLLVLGEDYLERQKRELSDWEYMIEIENHRSNKLPNGFYPSLNDSHYAEPVYEYAQNESGRIYTKSDNFRNRNQKLELSFDFNAGFTSAIVCQEQALDRHVEFRILESMFAKPIDTDMNLIDTLVDKFIENFKDQKAKIVDIYGDRNGNNKNPQSTRTFYDQVILRLEKSGWTCFKKVDGLDMDMDLRYYLVDSLLGETNALAPKVRFHFEKAKSLFLSMQNAPILLGFKKDKASERQAIPQELATHLSDCFDNIVCRKYSWILTGDSGHQIWIS
jgi:hypothetical protein